MSSLAALHDAYAAEYDSQMLAYGCFLPEALFGLCYEFVQPGQVVLDAGIGSGLSAALFARAGAAVYGMDFSPVMLALCRMKAFAMDLQLYDVEAAPWPYPDQAIGLVVCCGVMHFIRDLETIFGETRRVLQVGGLFAFTTKTPRLESESVRRYEQANIGGFEIFAHAPAHVQGLLAVNRFDPVRNLRCFVGQDPFDLWVVRKRAA